MLLSIRSSSKFDRLPNDDGRSSILFLDNWQYRNECRLPKDSGSTSSRFWPDISVTANPVADILLYRYGAKTDHHYDVIKIRHQYNKSKICRFWINMSNIFHGHHNTTKYHTDKARIYLNAFITNIYISHVSI